MRGAVAYGVSVDVSWWPTIGQQGGLLRSGIPFPGAAIRGRKIWGRHNHAWWRGGAGCSEDADLLSVRALRLKWRMIWWSGSGCFSTSSSSSASTLGDFYTNQCRQVLSAYLNTCHTTACEEREGKAQGTECNRLKAQRETATSYIYFRTEALRMQGSGYKCMFVFFFFRQLKKHSNFGLKQNERKSQSLATGEAL